MMYKSCSLIGGSCAGGDCTSCALISIAGSLETIATFLEEIQYTLEYGSKADESSKE